MEHVVFLFCLIFVSLWTSVKITNGQSINGYSTIYSDEFAENGLRYQFSYPLPQNYRIFLFMDPCRLNNYSCCMNVFGEAEYPLTLLAKNELERQVVVDLFAEDTEVAQNYQLVYEDGSNVLASQQVAADDSSILDYTCLSFRNPHLWCAGKNYAFIRSPYRPPCADNNSSLDALGLYGRQPGTSNPTDPSYTPPGGVNPGGCQWPNGTWAKKCTAIGYTMNTFIPQCSPNQGDNCGTYIEIHQRHGTPYSSETDVISSVKLDQYNVSGAYTTVIPLTWMGNQSRVICAYSENFLRIGSVVYILPTAPQCCCPYQYDFTISRTFLGENKPDDYDTQSLTFKNIRVPAAKFHKCKTTSTNPTSCVSSPTYFGGFFCPWGPNGGSGSTATYDIGGVYDALAVDNNVIGYPFCQSDQHGPDILMCSVLDQVQNSTRYYTRPCAPVNYSSAILDDAGYNDARSINKTGRVEGYISIDLTGKGYNPPINSLSGKLETGYCPWFKNCARIGGPGSPTIGCLNRKGQVLSTTDSTVFMEPFPDSIFNFIGRVGVVTKLDNTVEVPQVWVTFNSGRSSYQFDQQHVQLNEPQRSMYEAWWVVRSATSRVVQKRKGFNITSPQCTFDKKNNRYFPWAELNYNDEPLVSTEYEAAAGTGVGIGARF